MVPMTVGPGSDASTSRPAHVGSAHHGPVVRPASFDRDLRTARTPDPLRRFRVHPEPQLPPTPAAHRPEVDTSTQAVTQTAVPAASAPAAPAPSATSFDGLDYNNWGDGHPPDTVGDVGPNHYVQAVNTAFAVYSKTGTRLAAATFDALWADAPDATSGQCKGHNFGDPTVVYDSMADRWIVADFAFTGDGTVPPFYECIAVSKTADPVSGGWWLYAVRTDDTDHPWLADYPKMAIWPDGLYMSANMFGPTSYEEVRLWAFNRSDLESGAPLRQVVVDLGSTSTFGLLPANLRGDLPPAGRDALFVAESLTAWAFDVYKLHVDYTGNTSSLTSAVQVAQTAYNVPIHTPLVPTPGNGLDSLGDRLMMQAQYRNIGGIESVWVTHTVRMSSNGPFGTQWAQLDVTGGTVATTAVQQQIYGNLSSDGVHRWMSSLAVDDTGAMALGYSAASASLDPAIRYAGRLSNDPLGTLPRTEASMIEGGGSQTGNCGPSTCTRWGDYSAMSIDPSDGCTFWYTTEYYAADGLDWHTRIGHFAFPTCTSPASSTTPAPATGTYGGTTSLSATVTSGGSPVVGRSVSFALNGTSKGSAVTDSTGTATLANVSLAGINAGSYASGVSASFTGDDTYPPSSGTATLTVSKASQTITFTGAPASATYGTSFNVTATASSGLTVSVASSGACSNSGTSVQMTSGTGTCSLTANQGGNTNYSAATQATQSTTATKAAQTIALTVPSTKVYTDAPFTVSGTATSGLSVTLGVSGGPCTINGSTVTITGVGTCSVTGDQAGNGNYLAAPTASSDVAIGKAGQTISFDPVADQTYGDPDVELSATSSSGLTVSFAVGGSDPCTVTGTTLHLTHAGICHITATQAGDSHYNAATAVVQNVTIDPAATATALGLSVGSVQYSDRVTLTATVTPGSSVGQVQFFVAGQSLGTAPVSAGVAQITAPVGAASGPRTAAAVFTSGDADHAGSIDTAPLTVTRENATATVSAAPFAFTASPSTATKSVRLRASVTDVADGFRGDVRRADVTFVDRRTGKVISGCGGLAVGLISAADPTKGSAQCTAVLGAAARTAGTVSWIGVVVGGDYTRSSGLDDALVTVARPRTARLAAAGGALRASAPGGSLAATKGSLVRLGVTLTYPRDRSRVDGGLFALVVHNARRYLVRTSGLQSIRGTAPQATVRGTAVVTDVTAPGSPTTVAKGCRIVLRLLGGTPGQAALEVRRSGGQLVLSTRWSGTATLLQALASGRTVVR
jgi:hypothetical protein